ncbi:MAG: hypothetical protein IKV53_02095 [Clostridia bacterium]|nr:hypothetical protein [Clostridia bacterium]
MKKLILFLTLILAVAVVFTACKKEEVVETPTPDEEIDYSEYFLNPREEAELCYLSFFDSSDFGSYIFAYPESSIEYFAKKKGMEYYDYCDMIEKQCEELAKTRIALYGEDFKVGYVSVLDEKIEGEDFETLKSELGNYGIDTATVTKAFRGHYQYTLFNAEDPEIDENGVTEHNFGKVPEDAEILFNSTVVFTLIYIEDDGWYVSPTDYEFK